MTVDGSGVSRREHINQSRSVGTAGVTRTAGRLRKRIRFRESRSYALQQLKSVTEGTVAPADGRSNPHSGSRLVRHIVERRTRLHDGRTEIEDRHVPVDERLQIAYDAAAKFLAQQDTTLSNLRNRTTALVSSAAVATSFAAGLGLINTDPTKGALFPHWAAYAMLVTLLAIGGLSLFILWPVKQFVFGPQSEVILADIRDSKSADEILARSIDQMNEGHERNASGIGSRMRAFRAAAPLLIAEVVVLILSVTLR